MKEKTMKELEERGDEKGEDGSKHKRQEGYYGKKCKQIHCIYFLT
jgi:hypothetical protein